MEISIKEEIEKIVSDLIQNYNPQLILLFGSYTKEAYSENSDIDLLLIKETKKRPIWRRIDARKAIDTFLPMDIIVYTPKEFNQLRRNNSPFIREILSQGKILYERQS
jgi:predicted nucleotidyltransferase